MDVNTFLSLPDQEKFNFIHLRDWPVHDYLRGIHQGRIIATYDRLWAAEHLDNLLRACWQAAGRMIPQQDKSRYDPDKLELTAKFILDTLEFAETMMDQLGLQPLTELNDQL